MASVTTTSAPAPLSRRKRFWLWAAAIIAVIAL
jgi:hypothetical protein